MLRVLRFTPRPPKKSTEHDYLLDLAIETITSVASFPNSVSLTVITLFAQEELWRLQAEQQRCESRKTRDD